MSIFKNNSKRHINKNWKVSNKQYSVLTYESNNLINLTLLWINKIKIFNVCLKENKKLAKQTNVIKTIDTI